LPIQTGCQTGCQVLGVKVLEQVLVLGQVQVRQ
jgi:hypothetical protein